MKRSDWKRIWIHFDTPRVVVQGCRVCGAGVPLDLTETHEQWHENTYFGEYESE